MWFKSAKITTLNIHTRELKQNAIFLHIFFRIILCSNLCIKSVLVIESNNSDVTL